jgi:hypothetical protein
MKSGNLNFLEPSGHIGHVMGLIYLFIYAGTPQAGEKYLVGNPKKQIGFILNPRYC